MESAKNAVKDFMAKSGHHDTTVHEKVAPAVTHETINRERHENITTAIDKEVHQDHYHTSVQPIKDREVLPEQHHHNIAAVEHRQFEHGNDREIAERLKAEAAQFRDERVEGAERHTQTVAPTIAGEHIHHHVHETIQPVVNKETIEPHVVHTTVPIHEVHHNAAQHHTASALPAVSLEEFKRQGGVLTGREERYDGFEGEPRSVGGVSSHSSSHSGAVAGGLAGAAAGHHSGHTGRDAIAGAGAGAARDHHHNSSTTGHHDSSSGLTGSTTGHHDSSSGLTGSTTGHHNSSSGLTGSTTGHHNSSSGLTGSTTGHHHNSGSGLTGTSSGVTGDRDRVAEGHSAATSTGEGIQQKTKPSLLDKLNPAKDSDHDGKKGLMD